MSAWGHSRLGRASSKSGHVRYAAESGSKFSALDIIVITVTQPAELLQASELLLQLVTYPPSSLKVG
jgi:hypothetical protein